ncbi:MAG TPA: hypothetical protein VK508_06960 [Cyclobacteriaceae bacterium]|nr:hypothetical protein [Cyclobacteriaceae bacterium]
MKRYLVALAFSLVIVFLYQFANSRITPLNADYGESNIPPDLHEVYITASIVSTIDNEDFINEIGLFPRLMILLLIVIINVVLLTYINTRWIMVNIIIALAVFLLLNMAGNLLIVYLFGSAYYLNLDELTICLLITSISTLVLNVRNKVPASDHN